MSSPTVAALRLALLLALLSVVSSSSLYASAASARLMRLRTSDAALQPNGDGVHWGQDGREPTNQQAAGLAASDAAPAEEAPSLLSTSAQLSAGSSVGVCLLQTWVRNWMNVDSALGTVAVASAARSLEVLRQIVQPGPPPPAEAAHVAPNAGVAVFGGLAYHLDAWGRVTRATAAVQAGQQGAPFGSVSSFVDAMWAADRGAERVAATWTNGHIIGKDIGPAYVGVPANRGFTNVNMLNFFPHHKVANEGGQAGAPYNAMEIVASNAFYILGVNCVEIDIRFTYSGAARPTHVSVPAANPGANVPQLVHPAVAQPFYTPLRGTYQVTVLAACPNLPYLTAAVPGAPHPLPAHWAVNLAFMRAWWQAATPSATGRSQIRDWENDQTVGNIALAPVGALAVVVTVPPAFDPLRRAGVGDLNANRIYTLQVNFGTTALDVTVTFAAPDVVAVQGAAVNTGVATRVALGPVGADIAIVSQLQGRYFYHIERIQPHVSAIAIACADTALAAADPAAEVAVWDTPFVRSTLTYTVTLAVGATHCHATVALDGGANPVTLQLVPGAAAPAVAPLTFGVPAVASQLLVHSLTDGVTYTITLL